ncbi:MAG TPA: DUF2268 domain-containing putative Zn-dependent protease [Candidatus Paceibacterota bacterium]|nr:DUF2268 domain-containing putative Zn-dependent protease [Candidatus Paceibacterota bacterium]
MKLNIHATGTIEHKHSILSLIRKAAQKVSSLFPLESIDVVVVSGKTPLGVTGNSFYDNTIMIIVDQKHTWEEIQKNVQPTFYHELHHLARIKAVGYGRNLGGAVITEGLALKMEEEMGGDVSPWKDFSNKKEREFVYDAFQEEKEAQGYDHDKWFFGENFPKWAGYRLGYILVSLYCKQVNKRPSELFAVPANKILKLLNSNSASF